MNVVDQPDCFVLPLRNPWGVNEHAHTWRGFDDIGVCLDCGVEKASAAATWGCGVQTPSVRVWLDEQGNWISAELVNAVDVVHINDVLEQIARVDPYGGVQYPDEVFDLISSVRGLIERLPTA